MLEKYKLLYVYFFLEKPNNIQKLQTATVI